MSNRAKRIAATVARIAVAILLLLLLWRYADLDLEKIYSILKDIHAGWILTSVVFILAVRVLIARRWQYMLSAFTIDTSLKELIRVVYISMFLGYFFPGGLGPDVVRGVHMVKLHGRPGDIGLSLLLDRIVGVYALFTTTLIMAVVAALLGIASGWVIPMLVAQALLILGWLIGIRILDRMESGQFEQSQQKVGAASPWQRIVILLTSVRRLTRDKAACAKVLLISFVTVAARCGIFYSLFLALGSVVSPIYCMLVIPLMSIAVLLPVSLGGLGLREATLVYFFAAQGVEPEVSTTVGLLSHFLQMVVSLPSVLLLFGKRSEAPSEAS